MIYQLSFRDPLGGGAVHSGSLTAFPPSSLEEQKVNALYSYEQVTFLLHGFNVGEDEGRISLSEMANHLPSAYPGAIVFVLWPGDSHIGPLSYPFTEGHQADDTAYQLARIIEDHVAPGTPLNFIAHSLGCRVTMETVAHLYQMEKERGINFSGKPRMPNGSGLG